jgi:hypothetical protein
MLSWGTMAILTFFIFVTWFVTKDDEPMIRHRDVKYFYPSLDHTINVYLFSDEKCLRTLHKRYNNRGVWITMAKSGIFLHGEDKGEKNV